MHAASAVEEARASARRARKGTPSARHAARTHAEGHGRRGSEELVRAVSKGQFAFVRSCESRREVSAPSCRHAVAPKGTAVVVTGDSTSDFQARNWLYHALACASTDGEAIRLTIPRSFDFEEWDSRSWCTTLTLSGTVLCYVSSSRTYGRSAAQIMDAAASLPAEAKESTLFLVNVGVHFNDPEVLRQRTEAFAEAARHSKLRVAFRETTPQFFAEGTFVTLKRCADEPEPYCHPIRRGNSTANAPHDPDRFNKVSTPILRHHGIPIVRVWQSFVDSHEERVAVGCGLTNWVDCMHTCPLTAANTRLTERVVAKHMAHVAPAQLDPEQLAHHLEHALLGANLTTYGMRSLADFGARFMDTMGPTYHAILKSQSARRWLAPRRA